MPRDCHLDLEPRTHSIVARSIANESLDRTQPITSLYDLSHLIDNRSARRRRKKSASVPNMPSIEKHKGVKLAWRAKQASIYLCFFSASAQHNTACGVQLFIFMDQEAGVT